MQQVRFYYINTENINTVTPVNEVLLEQLTTVPQMINKFSAFY
jgi:hypothetical protein